MKRITNFKKNDKFNTTLINFIYQFRCDTSEIMAYTIISKLLSKSNNLFKDEASFIKERLNKYIISFNVLCNTVNDVNFINFSLLIPNSDLIDESNIKDQITYLLDTIYNNNINDIELFNKEKRLYLESLLNNYKNIDFIAEKNLLDIIDNSGNINKIKYRDIDDINRLKLDDIINFYNKYIRYIEPKIFVNGNLDFNNLDNIIDEYLKDKNLKRKRAIKKYDIYYNNKLDNNHTKEVSKFYQSILYLVIGVENYSKKDHYILYLLHLLLSSSSSNLLIMNLRRKANLVYTCRSNVLIKNGLLFIKANTSMENINFVRAIINELLKDLKDNTDKYKKFIKNILNVYEIDIKRELDDFYTISSNIINKYYNVDITKEEEYEILKSIKTKDIKGLMERLTLIYDYELEGDL